MPDDPTFENQPVPGTDDVPAEALSDPEGGGDETSTSATTVEEAKASDTDVAHDWDKDSVDPKDPDPQAHADEAKTPEQEALDIQREANPTIQTYDKSAGLNDDGGLDAAPEGHVIPQGGIADHKTDEDVEYPEDNLAPSSQLLLDRETAPYAPVAPGDGPDEGQVPGEVPDGPSVVQGKKDTVPNPSGEPMSVQEQIDRGIGVPSPNVETPGYDEPDEPVEPGRELTETEQSQADGTNNPQHGPVAPNDPAGATEGPR